MIRSLLETTSEDRPTLALTLILTALAVLSLQDALVKFSSATTTLWQFQVIRAVFNLAILGCYLGLRRRLDLMIPARPGAVMLRTGIMVGVMICIFAGAPFLTLAQMAAGLYTFPVFNVLLSWVVLGERPGPIRLAAVAVAVAGAALVIRPEAQGAGPIQLLPVLGGFLYALNTIVLRSACREENTFTLATWLAGGFLLACLMGVVLVPALPIAPETRAAWPFLLTVWPAVTGAVVGLALVASICNVTGNVLIVKAYQSAELSWLAPFDYSYFVFVVIWGLLLFGDWPDAASWLGLALIAAAGITIALRSGLTRRQRPQP